MDMVIPHDLSQKFASAREDLHKLKAELDKVQAMIDTDHLIPDDLSMEVFSSLSSCRASKSALTEALEKYAVSAAFSMQEMEQAIIAALDGEAMRTLLVDYFRLTSDAETVLARLNDAKKALQAQCSLPHDELKAILAPYQVMVDYASGKRDDVTDDESQLIEQVMGRSISRALDKGQIRLGDIEEGERWLAGVADTAAAVAVTADCQEPMAPVVEEPVPPAVDQAPSQSPAAMEEPTPADTPENAEAAKADETAAHEPAGAADAAPLEEAPCGAHDSEAPEQPTALWADFQGYVQEGSVTVDDVPANRFRASDFQSMARKHKVRADVLKAFLDTRIMPVDAGDEAYYNAWLSSRQVIESLKKKGYIATVHFADPDGAVREYYTPSSMCYEMTKNQTVMNSYRGTQSSKQFSSWQESIRKPAHFTTLYLQRCRLFSDWFHHCCNLPSESILPSLACVYPHTEYVFACYPGKDDKSLFFVPALFEPGTEMETIDIITIALDKFADTCCVVMIVQDPADIAPLTQTICDGHPEYFDRLRFTMAGSSDYFNGHGEQVFDIGMSDAAPAEDAADGPRGSNPEEAPDTAEGPAPAEAVDEASETGAVSDPGDAASDQPDTSLPPEAEADTAPASDARDAQQPTEADQTVPSLEPVEAVADPALYMPQKVLDADEVLRYVQQYEAKAHEAYASGRPDVGSVLLKSMCAETALVGELQEEYERLRLKDERYAFATGDPMLKKDYRVSHLQTVFGVPFGQDEAYDTLALAAYLRMYFSPDAGIEAYGAASVQFPDNIALKRIAPLNDLMYKLADYVRTYFSGVDGKVLKTIFNSSNFYGKLTKAQKEAASWLVDYRLMSSSHMKDRIKNNRKQLFGPNSVIHAALNTVASNDLNGIALVEAAMDMVGNRHTAASIESMMDEMWDKTASGRDRAPLIGSERNSLKMQLLSIFQTLANWYEAAQATRMVESGSSAALQQSLSYILEKLNASRDAIAELDAARSVEVHGARLILADTVQEMIDRFSVPDVEDKRAMAYYIRFLEQPLVAVTDGFVPYIERPEEETSPFNFCQRAAACLTLPRVEWPDVIARMFRRSADRVGGDYGCAKVLHDYLELTEQQDIWPHEYANIDRFIDEAQNPRSKAVDALQTWQQDFQGRLDMADGDEWFREPDDRKRLQGIISMQQSAYCFTKNFGFYGRAMLRVLENMSREAEQQKSAYKAQLALARASNAIPTDAPIYTIAEEMIEKNRFGAFRSYLQMAEHGETDVSESRLSDQRSYFATFCAQCSDYCNKARLTNENPSLQVVFRRSGFQQNATGRTGMILVQNWPESESSNPMTQAGKIRHIAEALGLEVARQYVKGTGVHLDLTDPGRVLNYPHPIADFGSRMYARGLQVHTLYGNLIADVLATKIREILQKNNDQSYLIIVNCALSLQERRKLARLVSGGMMQSSFVILDRALALYLASIPQAERWKALLQCSLPFQVINPYSENSAVEIPPEMFIGRTRELDSIRRPDGANLIYGGRQLGKTALLKRARVLEHRPSADSWAVYEDIKNKKSAEASVRIAKTLTQEKFFDQLPDVHSWEDLLDAIEHQLMEVHQQRKLLLLLDEGDVFLAAAGQNKYTEIDGWKQLQDRTGNRFKCVMAGLHNVLRLNNSMALTANSTLPHMQGLTVEPLDFKDARALLEIPLSYLGFTIPEEDEDIITQILYNTNYFPGLVHFYASRLVEYAKTHANEMREPPYELRTETLLSLLAEKNFHDLRNDRIRMTLYIDANEHSYYDILATTMCYGYNISEDYKLLGMTADDIQHECTSLTPNCSIASLTNAQLRALLDELVTLNIFRVENDRYQFRRPSFTEIFDSPDAVEQHFLEVLEREAT